MSKLFALFLAGLVLLSLGCVFARIREARSRFPAAVEWGPPRSVVQVSPGERAPGGESGPLVSSSGLTVGAFNR